MKDGSVAAGALVAAALLLLGGPALAQEPGASAGLPGCVACHKEEATDLQHDIHQGAGVTCITCHGGDPAGTTRDVCREGAPGFLGIPKRVQITELCGSCHGDLEKMHTYGLRSDQLALYKLSGHGKELYSGGDEDVATCVSCHGAHRVFAIDDPRSPVYPTNVPATCGGCHDGHDASMPERTNVYEQYQKGIHGQRLLEDGIEGSPSCVTCHGSHGAKPPGMARVPTLCGKCHAQVQEHFLRGPHAGLAAEAGCVACHGNHAIETTSVDMLSPEKSTCNECHEGEEKPALVAREILTSIRRFEEDYEAASKLLQETRAQGLLVEDEESFLRDAHRSRAQLMDQVHALDVGLVKETVERGQALLANIRGAIDKKHHTFRDRQILASGFFLLICAWSGLLLLKRRGLLAADAAAGPPPPTAGGSGAAAPLSVEPPNGSTPVNPETVPGEAVA